MISRRKLLKALGIGSVAVASGVTIAKEARQIHVGADSPWNDVQAAVKLLEAHAVPRTAEVKVTGTAGYRVGDNIEIRQPAEYKLNEPLSAQIIPDRKMYMIHGIKDRETLIVSEC